MKIFIFIILIPTSIWGHYTFGYIKDFDAGGNKNGDGESVEKTFDQYAFTFSGSYYF